MTIVIVDDRNSIYTKLSVYKSGPMKLKFHGT